MHFSKSYVWKIAFIKMDTNTVIIITEKMEQNLRYFNLKFLFKFFYSLVTSQNIELWDWKLFIVTSSFSYFD